jgi:hypothetical protein
MRFFLKVLVLVGLIVIGKLEKQTTMMASKQTESISLPVYSQNNDNVSAPRTAGSEKDIQKVSYQFSY